MNKGFKVFLGIVGFVVVMFLFVWVVQGNDFFMYKVFAPKYEQVRRETFEQSKVYNQGMIQELDSFYREYSKASPEHKEALKSIILHRMADYDENKLPGYLKTFVQNLRNESELKEMNY